MANFEQLKEEFERTGVTESLSMKISNDISKLLKDGADPDELSGMLNDEYYIFRHYELVGYGHKTDEERIRSMSRNFLKSNFVLAASNGIDAELLIELIGCYEYDSQLVSAIVDQGKLTIERLMEINQQMDADSYIVKHVSVLLKHATDLDAMMARVLGALVRSNAINVVTFPEFKYYITDGRVPMDRAMQICEKESSIEHVVGIQSFFVRNLGGGMNYERLCYTLCEYYTMKMFHKVFNPDIDRACDAFSVTPEELFAIPERIIENASNC